MNIKKPDDDELIIKMIYTKNGNLTEIAKAFGVVRRTVSEWIANNPKLKEALDDALESLIDFCETQAMILTKGIPIVKKNPITGKDEIIAWEEKPDAGMIKYILSTKGKHRGYTEKNEIDITSGGEKIMGWVVQPIAKKDADSTEDK